MSDKRAEAARRNGAKGGRPRKHRYFELFAEIDEPPTDSLKLCIWAQRINAIAMRETIQGRGNPSLNAEIRATSRVISALVPSTTMAKALEVIKAESTRGVGKLNKRGGEGKVTQAPERSKPVRGGQS